MRKRSNQVIPEVGRQIDALVRRWRRDATRFHRMGKGMTSAARGEYMQTAAAFRKCASELSRALKSPELCRASPLLKTQPEKPHD